MRSKAQVVTFVKRRKVLHDGLVPKWIAYITSIAKADGKSKYLFTDLAETCSVALPTKTCTHFR